MLKHWMLFQLLTLPVTFAFGALSNAVDNTDLVWTSSGDLTWDITYEESSDGVDAAVSGSISHRELSRISTTVIGPGTLTFTWRVSCEEDYDWLRFHIDDIETNAISGESGWQTITQRIDSGAHELSWEYVKDKSDTAGSDCGWLDQVGWIVDGSFADWASKNGLSGDLNSFWDQDHNSNGIPCGLEYTYGTNLISKAPLLRLLNTNNLIIVESLVQDTDTLPYSEVQILCSTNLTAWTHPVLPVSDAPTGREWHTTTNHPPCAFFKLEAKLK